MRVAEVGALESDVPVAWPQRRAPVLDIVLDNVRSTFNVGAIFRIADGVGVESVHLCGITPTPEHPRIAKTALGAEATVSWAYFRNSLDAVAELRSAGRQVWVLENDVDGLSIFDVELPEECPGIALVAGNEIVGVDPGLVRVSDQILHLPMGGLKGSLNVAVAVGIAAYLLRGALHSTPPP